MLGGSRWALLLAGWCFVLPGAPLVAPSHVEITTWNVLAPCYKRLSSVMPPVLQSLFTARESSDAKLWEARCAGISSFVKEKLKNSDVICLQEFWMHPKALLASFEHAHLLKDYDLFVTRREGDKQDGVATLVRKGLRGRELSGAQLGDGRVAQTLLLEGLGEPCMVLNTHLTFPHGFSEREAQLRQIQQISTRLESQRVHAGLPETVSQIVCGDFNADPTSRVCAHLTSQGFSRCQPADCEAPRVTHYTHLSESVEVDHIFFRGPIRLVETIVEPLSLPCAAWPSDFTLSDHRPVTGRLLFTRPGYGWRFDSRVGLVRTHPHAICPQAGKNGEGI